MMTHRTASDGFTLIELLIVVAIIAILAAIAVPNFVEAQVRAKVARVDADMRTLTVALQTYAVDHNSFPGDFDVGLIKLTTPVDKPWYSEVSQARQVITKRTITPTS